MATSAPQPLEAKACHVDQLRPALQFTPAPHLPPAQLAIPLRLTPLPTLLPRFHLFSAPPPNLQTLPPPLPEVRSSSLTLPASNHRAAVLSPSPHVTVSTSTKDAPQRNPTPISAGQTPSSAWQVVSTGRRKLLVFCPVCKIEARRAKQWFVEHMKEHNQESSRPCQMCTDQGDPFTTVAPEQILRHIQYVHERKSSPQSPIRTTAPVAPQPVSVHHAPVWEFVERGGGQMVVCPSCPSDKNKSNTTVKPKNIVRHLAKAHRVSYQDRLCPGCKVVVPPEQLVNHTSCKNSNQTNATDETPLKRKVASTDATSLSLKSAKAAKLCGSATMQSLLLMDETVGHRY